MEVLKIIVWPVTVFILVIIILTLFKNTLIDILKRITKLKYGDTIAEVSQARQNSDEKSLVNSSQNSKPNEAIEKFLGILSTQTIEAAKIKIDSETKILEAKDDKAVIATLSRYAQGIFILMQFDRLYFLIYGSQVNLLEYCNSHPYQTREELKPFYDVAKERYQDSYANYEYDTYFDFLLREELLIVSGVKGEKETYQITWLARDFLKYMIDTAKPAKFL